MKNKLSENIWRTIAISGGIIIFTALFTTGYLYVTRDTNPIPRQLRSQLTFSPFVIPKDSSNYLTTDYKFSTVEGQVPILSYIITTKGQTISVSEYSQPPEFSEIPDYKNQFLNNVINQYSSASSSSGTIYLGRAVKQNNKQMAIMIERGLLVFMLPDKDMNDAQWRSLGDQLDVQKMSS